MADSDYTRKQFTRDGGLMAASLSGTSPTSGTIANASALASFSGPWLVETQDLHIDYVRVPYGSYYNIASKAVTLASATLTYGQTQSTQLAFIVKASYSRSIDHANYSTSSYQQPQLFEINAVSADPYGVGYTGNALAVGSSALGPMGSILTLQPYYRRTLYNNETLVTSTVDVASFGLVNASAFGQTDVLTDYEFWKDKGCVPGTMRGVGGTPGLAAAYTGTTWFGLYGPYNYDAESPVSITSLIDWVGHYVTTGHLYTSPSPYNSTYQLISSYREGIPEYSKFRHKY